MPFQIVREAPVEIAAHGDIFPDRARQQGQIQAQDLDPFIIVNLPVGLLHIDQRAFAVFTDHDLFRMPELVDDAAAPIHGGRLEIEVGDAGHAVLLVSLELEEVMSISDRILVMYEGEIVGEFLSKDVTPQELGLYMSGAKRMTPGEMAEVEEAELKGGRKDA